MQTHSKIAVAGATGRVGRHVVEVLEEAGHDVVRMSRSTGVNVVTGEGLSEALQGVDSVVDAACVAHVRAGAGHGVLHRLVAQPPRDGRAGRRPADRRGVDHRSRPVHHGLHRVEGPPRAGHAVGPDPGPHPARGAVPRVRAAVPRVGPAGGRHLRAGDAHAAGRREDRRGGSRRSRQRIDARTGELGTTIPEIAGPREESLVDVARLLAARRGDSVRIEAVSDPDDPEQALYASGALLPGPDAVLAGPTFEQWLDSA